jgi:diaminopimelate decarboxylase
VSLRNLWMTVPNPATAKALVKAAGAYGTPSYLTDLAELDRTAGEMRSAFPDPWLRQYSLKANPLPAIVARLAEGGLGANVVSGGEWESARRAQIPNHRITFEGIGKTDAELQLAVAAAAAGDPLRWLTLESTDEALTLRELAKQANLDRERYPLDVLLRLNPGVAPETHSGLRVGAKSSKFGMAGVELKGLAASILKDGQGLRVRGVHVHVGSQLNATTAWATAAVKASRLVRELSRLDERIDTVDIGGGFPSGEESTRSPADFREQLDSSLVKARVSLPARAAVEPGRYLVASAGWLIAKVLHVRHRNGAAQIVIDASFAELIRPALYGARHAVLPLTSSVATSPHESVQTLVEGAVCESTDSFGVHMLPPLVRGDLVVLENTGAYAASMFSHYNGRPQPPEVLLQPDGSLSLARARQPFSP